MDNWLKIEENLMVNLAQITHVQWGHDGTCALWLGHAISQGVGTEDADTGQDMIIIEDPETAHVLRAYLSAHISCIWCWADDNPDKIPAVLESGGETLQ